MFLMFWPRSCSFAILLTAFTYMHAVTMFGASMDSKRITKPSGNLEDTSNKDCGFRVDAPLAISAALLLAQGTNDTW